ncbi:MAG: glycosyltransferase [Acidimicrobiales bacterium]
MNVLFTCSPGLGHVHPMLPLASALVARGHDVRWAVAPEVAPRVEAAGFPTFAAGMGVAARHAELARRYPEILALPPAARPERMFPALFGAIAAPAMLADLLPVVAGWSPALVVHDAAELAGPVVAARAGVPSVTHGFGALIPAPRVAAASEAVAGLWRSIGLAPRPYAGCYDHLYLDIYPPSMRPGSNDHVGRVPSLRPVPVEETGGAEEAPATARRLVYVTFGTLFNDPTGVFTAAVAGAAHHDVDVLVTVGPNGDPAALGAVAGHVRVERYVPQMQVLPRCAAVVSHAGSGTFLATLGLGIPQLCLPQGADQFLNAGQGAAAGAAISLMADQCAPDTVAGAVGRLLKEPAFGEAAGRIAAEIAAMPGPGEVAAVLESLL